MSLLNFSSFIPNNDLLKKYVAYFYFSRNDDPQGERKYSFFPHVNTTLSFYTRARLTETDDFMHITHQPHDPFLKILTRQHRIKTVVQTGPVDKIGIVFLPLGLNHFIRESYGSIAGREVQLFQPAADSWDALLSSCYSITDQERRLELLENFLLSQFHPLDLHPLYRIMHELANVVDQASIQEIAERNHMSPRKLNRDFQKELAITPETFRMISRFRYAIDQKTQVKAKTKLTQLTHDSGYFDQSYMIRSFRKLTGRTPSAFFKECELLGDYGTFWKIHNTKNVV